MFHKFKNFKDNNEFGFTLIELLVVILIIGILAAIAIPLFLNQRKAAVTASLESDMKSTVTAVETYYAKNKTIDDLIADAGGKETLVWEATDTAHYPANLVRWNAIFPNNKVNLSKGSYIGLTFNKDSTATWQAHGTADYCLTGGNIHNPDWDYPGGNPLEYTKIKYYDSKLGGMVNLQQILAALNSGTPSACSGWGAVYKSAGGV